MSRSPFKLRMTRRAVALWSLTLVPGAACLSVTGDLVVALLVSAVSLGLSLVWRREWRPEPETPRDLGLEVLEAICALPLPIALDEHCMTGGHAAERTRMILEHLNHGVLVIGSNGNLLLSNSTARRVLNLRGRVTGWRRFVDAVGGALKPRIARGILKVSSGARWHHQIKAIRAGNGYFDFSFMRLSNHAQASVAILLTDLSQAQEVGRVAERFLSCISHELRTPLTSIQAAVEILIQMKGQPGCETEDFLAVIETECKRLDRVFDGVLEFSTLEASDAPWDLQVVNALDVVHTVQRQLEPQLAVNGLSIEVEAQDSETECLSSATG